MLKKPCKSFLLIHCYEKSVKSATSVFYFRQNNYVKKAASLKSRDNYYVKHFKFPAKKTFLLPNEYTLMYTEYFITTIIVDIFSYSSCLLMHFAVFSNEFDEFSDENNVNTNVLNRIFSSLSSKFPWKT